MIDRPQSLCGDMVPMTAVLSHDVEFVSQTLGSSEEIIFVQTHTTNPLLRPGTIDAAVTAYRAAVPVQHDSLFSVTAVRTRLYDTLGRAVNHNPAMLLRTQDLPPVWEENSCLYIFQARDLLSRQQRIGLRPLLFEMSQQESHDIDTEADWEAVAALMPCALKAGRVTAHTTATHVTAAPAEGVLAPRLRPVPGAPATQFEVLVTAPYAMPHIGSLTTTLRDFGLLVTLPDALAERMSEAQLLALAGRFDGTICGDDAYTPAVLRACSPRLKVVSKWGTGIDAIHAEAARSLGIAVCNTPGAFTQPVADSTLAYMLSFARGVAPTDAAMKAGGWDKVPGKSLSECTVGVVGCGAIGQAVCSRLRGFQATVLVNDPVPPPQKFLAAHPDVTVEKSLAKLLAASDYVVLACDLNPSSRHIIDQAALALMRRDAVLVNCSRGGLVDEEALVQALQCGLLAGAGLGACSFDCSRSIMIDASLTLLLLDRRVRCRAATRRLAPPLHGQRAACAAQRKRLSDGARARALVHHRKPAHWAGHPFQHHAGAGL